jgi:SMC interacting uncharacterized protein involved in chromosome segregation
MQIEMEMREKEIEENKLNGGTSVKQLEQELASKVKEAEELKKEQEKQQKLFEQ